MSAPRRTIDDPAEVAALERLEKAGRALVESCSVWGHVSAKTGADLEELEASLEALDSLRSGGPRSPIAAARAGVDRPAVTTLNADEVAAIMEVAKRIACAVARLEGYRWARAILDPGAAEVNPTPDPGADPCDGSGWFFHPFSPHEATLCPWPGHGRVREPR